MPKNTTVENILKPYFHGKLDIELRTCKEKVLALVTERENAAYLQGIQDQSKKETERLLKRENALLERVEKDIIGENTPDDSRGYPLSLVISSHNVLRGEQRLALKALREEKK